MGPATADPPPFIAPDVLIATRQTLHRVAEHLLAATRKRATGEITLVQGSGGFRTPELPDGTVLAVVGTELVVLGRSGERRIPLTSLAEVAGDAGLEAGFPWTKHAPATPFEPDAALAVDASAASALAAWFATGQQALAALAAELADEGPSAPQLFPEHFDLGVTAGTVNYGFSPGDEAIAAPYAYVGPHEGPPAGDEFWNAPFGAYRTWLDLRSVGEALEFFRAGRSALGM
ncbi:MAG TPA: hypothetical protein VF423_16880 [Actinomycetes bacterium]